MSVPYEKRQKKWIEKHSVQIGDRVYVVQKYDPKTCGDWEGSFWVFDMYPYVGKTGTIARIGDYGVQIYFGDDPKVKYWFLYSVLRKEKEMKKSYEERQDEWIKKNDLKIGDPVRLIRAASDGEDGWTNMWPSAANEWVGKTLEVRRISELTIACYNPEEEEDWFAFPYFVLEKVKHEEKEMKKSYEERQDEWIKKNDLKIGDKVRVIRKAESDEAGWLAVWAAEMDAVVGKAGVVKKFSEI